MKAIRIKQRALLLATAIVSIVLACCTKKDMDIPPLPADSAGDAGRLTIMQSKLFFENFTAKRNAKTKAADKYLNRLVVGNFVPNWDNAVASNDGIIGSVDVPIESQMKYVALRQYREDNITFVSRTSLYQKLIFVKNDTLNSIFPYLLSLIPDKNFYDNHQGEDIAGNFINLGNKGGFSGLAIYTTPYTGYLIRASRFENGRKTKKGSTATISAIADEGYVFAGWSGDYSGLDNPATFTVEDDMTIYARFYEESSDCGKLAKAFGSNFSLLRRYQSKIVSGGPEYGFILFNEKHQLGLSVNMYKVYDNNEIISKRITGTQDYLSLLKETGVCVY